MTIGGYCKTSVTVAEGVEAGAHRIESSKDWIMKFRHALRSPGWVLTFAAAIGAAAVAIYAWSCVDLFRDVAYTYAYLAREFAGHGFDAVSPLLPPLNIALAGLLCKAGVEAFTAAILVSGFFYVLTIWPLYFLLGRFMSKELAAWGTVCYIIAPKVMRFSCAGLPDSARNFFLVAAVAVLFAALDKPDWKKLALFGVSLGGLAMARGEGIILVAALLVAAMILLWRKDAYAFFGAALLRLAGRLALIVLLLTVSLAPRLWQTCRMTGYPLPDYRFASYLGLPHQPIREIAREDGLKNTGLENEDDVREREEAIAEATPGWRLGKIAGDFSRGAYELYLVFAAVGLAAAIRLRRYRCEYTVILALTLIHVPVYYFAGSAYRYYTFAVPLFLCWVMPVLAYLVERAGAFRYGRAAAFTALGAIAVAQLVNGLEMGVSQKEYYKKAAGEWIDANRGVLGIPPGKRPCVLFNRMVEINFWSGGIPRFEYSWTRGGFDRCTGFDVAVFQVGSEVRKIEAFRQRRDLREVATPFSKKIVMFVPEKP